MFAYCGNNPVTRVDYTGQGWFTAACAFVGGLVGAGTKIVSNVCDGKKWNEGVFGAFVGGAVYGAMAVYTGNIWGAGYTSAEAESLTNEVLSYIPGIAQLNGQSTTKELTLENISDSLKTIANDTVVNGTISAITGQIAGKVVPINSGWFKPQKFVSSFVGKYAVKSHLQTLAQSLFILGVEGVKHSFGKRLNEGQCPIFNFLPDTRIRVIGVLK